MNQNLVWDNLLGTDFDDPTFPWQDFRTGVDILPIYGDPTQGCSSALLRYQPGAVIPEHLHVGAEFLLILRGSQADARGIYTLGSLLINPAETSHGIFSEQGCIVLAIWEKPVKFINTK